MLTAYIPKDIRDYKEKLIAGFTARQLISAVVAVGICVPVYIYGRKYLPEDVISWLVILIAFPLGAIGFFRKNGMPAEKFVVCIFLYFIYPVKRIYKSANCLRNWQEQTKKEDLIRDGITKYNGKVKGKARKYFYNASLERAFLLEELEARGKLPEIRLRDLDKELLLARKPGKKQ
jgi:hypothetical protein